MPEDESATEQAQEAIAESVVDSAIATERIEETAPEVGDSAALVVLQRQSEVLNRLAAGQDAQNQLLQQNLSAFSRALANTDVSAQRAAEHSAAVEEAIAPEADTKPENVQPEQIAELPVKESRETAGKAWWWGKAAARHNAKKLGV